MSLDAQFSAITSRWEDNAPVDSDRISWDAFGAPHESGGEYGPFQPPDIDPRDPEAAIWQRLNVRMVPLSGRPLGVGETAKTWREGLIIIDTLFPRFSPPLVPLQRANSAGLVFHRSYFSTIRCRDMTGPEFTELDLWPNFKPIQVTIPFSVLEPSSTYVQDGYVR